MQFTVGFFLSLFGCSLFIYGWHYVTLYDPIDSTVDNPFGKGATNKEVLWFFRFYIGKVLIKLLPKYGVVVAKPIISCVVCMASIYGTIFYFLFTDGDPAKWPFFIIMLAGLNSIIKTAIKYEL